MNFEPSAKSRDFQARVRAFVRTHVQPAEPTLAQEVAANVGGDHRAWKVLPTVEALKARARAEGLWNLFLPDPAHGPGLSTIEYAPVAEETGHSPFAPEIFNCSAPDTGNMEVLHRYGSPEQQARWLRPLLEGTVRSVFGMTEPDVASSDATPLEATAEVRGGEVVVRGTKWWSSGLGHPRAQVAIVMAKTADASKDRHHQHSMVLVPLDAPGVEIRRMLPVFGAYDSPAGHGEVCFDDVRVPVSHFIGGPGMGFEIAQGRLGPGRIHHCMRCIGAAEEALALMVKRGLARTAFGRPLIDLGGNRERVAEARVAIDQARLLTLHAAWKLDEVGPLAAMTEISAIKVVAPTVLQQVVDAAIQIHGGAGLSDDTPLTAFFAQARALRIADGPDEVHKRVIAKIEIARHRT